MNTAGQDTTETNNLLQIKMKSNGTIYGTLVYNNGAKIITWLGAEVFFHTKISCVNADTIPVTDPGFPNTGGGHADPSIWVKNLLLPSANEVAER